MKNIPISDFRGYDEYEDLEDFHSQPDGVTFASSARLDRAGLRP
jgi:hypothetical protein